MPFPGYLLGIRSGSHIRSGLSVIRTSIHGPSKESVRITVTLQTDHSNANTFAWLTHSKTRQCHFLRDLREVPRDQMIEISILLCYSAVVSANVAAVGYHVSCSYICTPFSCMPNINKNSQNITLSYRVYRVCRQTNYTTFSCFSPPQQLIHKSSCSPVFTIFVCKTCVLGETIVQFDSTIIENRHRRPVLGS